MRTRSIAKELLLFSMPLILSGILQQLYSWADAFIVGHSGPEGEAMLTAVGATTSIFILLISSITGFTVGLSILAAQEYGRGNIGSIREITGRFLPMMTLLYAVLTALTVAFAAPILRLMDTPAEIFDHALQYLRIILVGVPFLAVYNLFAGLFRAVGNTTVSFYAVLISSLLNVGLDILLVLVFPFGVVGAAAATVVSQIAMTVFIVLYCLAKYPHLIRGEKDPAVGRDMLRQGFSFGLPPTVQNSITSVGNLILQNFMNGFGASTVLAVTTAYRVDSIMLLPVLNLGSAISSMVARSKGAGDEARIRAYMKTGLVLMVTISGLLAAAMYLFGAYFVGFFGVTGEALAIGDTFFRDLSMFYVFFGVATVLRSVLEGVGDITYCSFVGVGSLAIRIAASYLLRPVLMERSVAFAEGIAWLCLLSLLLVRTLFKLRARPAS